MINHMKNYSIVLLTFLVIFTSMEVRAQDVVITSCPLDYQLYPRNSQNSSRVEISGTVYSPNHNFIAVEIRRDGTLWQEYSQPLVYLQGEAHFSLQSNIASELANYRFIVTLDGAVIADADSVVSGDVFLIQGQSNAVAAALYPHRDRWVRSFGTMSTDAGECRSDTSWGIGIAAAYPVGHCSIGIWGERMGHLIVENFQVPVCIINGAKGGTRIDQHHRNEANPLDLDTIYGRLLYRVQKAGLTEAVKTIIWHQGEADTWYMYTHDYHREFQAVYNCWVDDYSPVETVYIWQIRNSFYCGNSQAGLRERQRNMAVHFEYIKIMSTTAIDEHDGLHFYPDGYEEMGNRIYPLIARDYYNSPDTLDIDAPDIESIYYTSAAHDELAMLFTQPVIWPDEPFWGEVLEDYIYLDDVQGLIRSGYANPLNDREIILTLNEPVIANHLSYPANDYYRTGWEIYSGPWITNRRGIGALTFFRFPIDDAFTGQIVSVNDALQTHGELSGFSVTPNPFNPTTTISFEIRDASLVELKIFDITGREIAALSTGHGALGQHKVMWNAEGMPSGVYFARLTSVNGQVQTQKLVLMK